LSVGAVDLTRPSALALFASVSVVNVKLSTSTEHGS